MAGFGCVVRNHSLCVIKACYGPLWTCGSIDVEVMALLFGLRELKKIGVPNCVVDGDSQTIIS